MSTNLLCDPIRALAFAVIEEGKLYRWGGKGPDSWDCSGLVTGPIFRAGGPDWRNTHHSQALFDLLRPENAPQAGRLAFYGSSQRGVSHVMWCVGDGRVYGACGGDSSVTTPELARDRGAKAMFRLRVEYRADFLGYRSLQLRTTPNPGAPRV
jgi:hypothetical protein